MVPCLPACKQGLTVEGGSGWELSNECNCTICNIWGTSGLYLGITLFVLFLNDIADGIDEKTNFLMYADDTKIWR